jgi:hypothetical protein
MKHLKDVHPIIRAGLSTGAGIEKLRRDSDRHKTICAKVAQMIYQDLQPCSIVDDIGFKELIAELEPRFQLPSRTTFSRTIIPEKYAELEVCIMIYYSYT